MSGRSMFRMQITSDEKLEKCNPETKKLIDKYLKNFATKRSPNSVKAYRSNFNIFLCWCFDENDNTSIINMTKLEMQEFFDYGLSELKWSNNRYSQVFASISELSKFIEKFYDSQYPNFRNLMPFIDRMPKENVRKKSVFKKDDLDNLLEWLSNNNKEQEACLLALMMSSGSRISELPRFKTTIIDYNNLAFDDLFLETTEEVKVKGRGVNAKSITKYLIKDLFVPYYNAWIPIREKIMTENGKEHDYIFIKSNGDPASTDTMRRWIDKWDSHLPQHLYPHSIRHWWCSYLNKIGLEKELIQYLQKWSSDALVDIYNDNTAKDKQWKSLGRLKDALSQDN